ncbi:hypothetical protein C1645_770677 [Glomus cerebriforme]|uniref:RING-type domain-containing protein n=1 Tax=Glomus cerebriforme TaxID=658196 RepID=A0A397SWW1_9GLOM|nr:hypothetical protein C1645_770677 [Glomus cerebriforme]
MVVLDNSETENASHFDDVYTLRVSQACSLCESVLNPTGAYHIPYYIGKALVILTCNHSFHLSCLLEHVQRNSDCPNCNIPIFIWVCNEPQDITSPFRKILLKFFTITLLTPIVINI